MLHSDSDAILYADAWAYVDEHGSDVDVLGSRGLVHKHNFRIGNSDEVSSRARAVVRDALTCCSLHGLRRVPADRTGETIARSSCADSGA